MVGKWRTSAVFSVIAQGRGDLAGVKFLQALAVGTSTFSDNTPDDISGGFTDLGGNRFH